MADSLTGVSIMARLASVRLQNSRARLTPAVSISLPGNKEVCRKAPKQFPFFYIYTLPFHLY